MNLRQIARRLANACFPAHRDADLARELAAHLALLEDGFRRRGLAADAARLAARRALGSAALTMDLHRDARSVVWLDDLRRDVRYAVRTLRRAPGFTAVAIATLALGIGATTAIFTLINDVELRSLPVRDANRLVVLGDARGSGTAVGRQGGSFTLFSYDLYRRLRDERIFERLCAVQSYKSRVAVRAPGALDAEPAYARLVSTNYFDVLGTSAAAGRLLGSGDEPASAPPVAVVSFRYWSDRFHRDASIVGSTVRIGRVPVTIVGVSAAEFFGETLEPDPPSFWLPLALERRLNPSQSLLDAPDIHWLYLIARPADGVTLPQAQDRVTTTLQAWLRARAGDSRAADDEAQIARTHVELRAGDAGITHARRAYAGVLQLLLAISSVVLLIGCANIANLLLARAAARETERAIRLAIGASRGRLIRQSLTESLILALAGGAAGLLVAAWGVHFLIMLVFTDTSYVPFSTSPDGRVLAFTFALSCAAALVFGALPALRGSAAPAARHTRRIAGAYGLIVAQVAMSLVVLTAAGALARSLANLAGQAFGFERERVLVVDVDPVRAGYDLDRLAPFYRELSLRLNALPGVTSASFSYYSPFDECCWAFSIALQDGAPSREEPRALLNRVSARYFETLGTRLVAGRAFDERDTPASAHVAVVNEAFVRRYLAGRPAIGSRFGIGGERRRSDLEIVGVVENAKYDTPRDDIEPMAFLPLLQTRADDDVDALASHFIRTIEIRTAGEPAAVGGAVRRTLAAIDPNLPLLRVRTLSDQVGLALNGDNVVATLAGLFAIVALALTGIGLYGLTAYTVQRRTREIGIRVALGARRGGLIAMVIREGVVRGAIGTAVGAPAAFAAVHAMRSALYGVSPGELRDAALASLLLFGCVVVAAAGPARRASRIEPGEALRHE